MTTDPEALLREVGADRRALGERVKGRSKKQAGRHYQALHDAEVERIRASVPDAPPILKPQGTCKVCGGGIIRFGRGWSHLDYTAGHEVSR